MENKYRIAEYFEDVETSKEHNGYFFSVKETLTIVILGCFCGLRNVKRVHQWASSARVRDFLKTCFGIEAVPCYYWILCLLKLIIPESFNLCFIKWVQSLTPGGLEGLTVSFDGKTPLYEQDGEIRKPFAYCERTNRSVRHHVRSASGL